VDHRGRGRLADIPLVCGKAKIPSCKPDTTIATYPDAMFVTRLP